MLFICGGKWQKPWLIFLKRKGHRIVLVDPFPNSPCVPLTDIYIQLDAKDIPGILNAIKELNLEIEFVTSDQTDVSTITVAALTEALGLYGNKVDSVRLFSNKFENRKFSRAKFNAHYPDFVQAFSAKEVIDFFHKTENEIIIKPVDAQSSRGIFKIDKSNLDKTSTYFNQTLSFSKEKYIIVEEFVSGFEITVEGVCINNTHHTLATSSKKHFRPGIASELRYPTVLRPNLERRLTKFHNKFIKKTGLLFGITHAEYIVNPQQTDFWLVEAACRGGGSLIPSHIVPWVSGYNLYETFYNMSIGAPVLPPEKTLNRSAILLFFEFNAGTIKSIEGIVEAKNQNGVLDLDLEFEVGSLVGLAQDDRSRQGYTIIVAENPTELDKRIKSILDLIKVEVAPA